MSGKQVCIPRPEEMGFDGRGLESTARRVPGEECPRGELLVPPLGASGVCGGERKTQHLGCGPENETRRFPRRRDGKPLGPIMRLEEQQVDAPSPEQQPAGLPAGNLPLPCNLPPVSFLHLRFQPKVISSFFLRSLRPQVSCHETVSSPVELSGLPFRTSTCGPSQ